MAVLYIQEYDGLGRTEQSDSVPVPAIDAATTDQTIAIGASPVSSNPFQAATRWVYLSADSVCSVKFSPAAAPVAAAATNFRLPANFPMLFRVPNVIAQPQLGQTPNSQSWQVSVITNT